MLVDYISNLKDILLLCDSFEKSVLTIYFERDTIKESGTSHFAETSAYIRRFSPIKKCVELTRILKLPLGDFEHDFYRAASSLENMLTTYDFKTFDLNFRGVRLGFQGLLLENSTSAFYSAFDVEEKERINEAIHNHFEGCNYSCVAMSVSATESRLLKLMCLVRPDSRKQLEKMTLGQLMFEYIENKDKYTNIVPEKHEPLLQLCNIYRTFSVHPKRQKISSNIAGSILRLAIEFLMDNDMKPEVVEAQFVASQKEKQV